MARSCDHSRGRLGAIVSALLSFSVTSGCNTGVPIEADISAHPSPVLQLSWAKARRTAEGIVVSGQIQQVHCCRYLRGHIHFDAFGPDGANVASTNAPWGEFNPRQIHSAWFRTVMPVPTEAKVSRIEIQFGAEPSN